MAQILENCKVQFFIVFSLYVKNQYYVFSI